MTLLYVIVLLTHLSYQWKWQPDLVLGGYQLLTSQDSIYLDTTTYLIWHRHVSFKVSIFAWRLLRDRLPSKSNLVARGIILSDAQYCMTECGVVESTQHLFISSISFGYLWPLVWSWIGLSAADPQFVYATCDLKARHSFLQPIWLLCVWVMWKERNNRIFNNSDSFISWLREKVKHYSYW